MAIQVHVTSVIRKSVGGLSALAAEGGTVAELIDDIERRYPGFRDQLVDGQGRLHRFVNVYLNDEDVRFLEGAETALREGDEVSILPALAGGAAAIGAAPCAPAASVLDRVGRTPLVEIAAMSPNPAVRIFAKLEGANPTGSVKDRIALRMIEAAEADGRLEPGQTILEPTSGNTGISLAMIGRARGYPVKVVMPAAVTRERVDLLESFGAEIIYSPGELGTNGSVREAERAAAAHPGWFMPFQYGNEDNPRAHYETTAPEIIEELPDAGVFVAGLGTGGTLTGVGRRLKEHNPAVRVVAAAPHPGDLVQGLRSLEEGYIPPVLDESVLDGRIVVDSATSFRVTRELTERTGIFAGVSSGAAIRAAQKVAERMSGGSIVCLLADSGWKYLSSGLWTRDYDAIEEDVSAVLWW